MHGEERPGDETATLTGDGGGRPLVCSVCGAVITTRQWAVERGGSHEHTFVNPAGIIWRISCYQRAPGCREAGEATGEFTWFTGYTWRYALCTTCAAHLGWSYAAGAPAADRFWGLITERLVEGTAAGERDA